MLSAEDLRQLLSRCPDGRLKLDLSGRWLTSVPEAVSQLTEVEVLDLSRIPIKTLPQHLCNLQNLKTLKLSWCDLIEIESVIICLTSLEELDLSGNKFATLPQDLSKLKHLKTLRLGDCDFTVVWSAITQLTSLEELDLSGNAAGTVPQDLSKLKHLKSLRLHRCELTEVCPAITQLTSLEELDLSWNEVRTMPQDLSQLKHLKKLRLVDCELTEVWSAITQLTSLEELDLSRNKVKTVPQDLSNLKHLKILKLESCELTEVWPVITQLTSLEELDLSQNKVKTVPQDLSNLKHLKILKLESCELTEVWPVITQLTSLEELDLSQNKVKTVPQDLSNLKHLKILKLESCELTEVWPVITQLTSLEELDLSWNEVETVPQDLSKLKHLKILRLRDCGLTEVWSAIIQLPSLEELDLSWNEVETVPLDLSKLKHLKILKLADCGLTEVWSAITQLTSLKGLVLNNNSLMELPLELTNLRNLKGLSLTGNPLKIPPTEICGRGVEAVFSYLAEIRLARATHCKVILLGCSMAGKTSLARTLINGEPSCVQEEDRTIVMDRIVWDPIAQGKNLRVSLIDFGGNDWYKIVHHLFIDKDSFFLLVVNLAGYVADNFERDVGSWLKLLLSRVSSPHWKLVGTHADQCTQEDISTKFEAIRRGIRCIYEREGRELIEPLEILVISSQSMSGISKLQEKMLGFVCRHGKVIPVAWLKTLSKLRSADHQDKPFLYFGDLGTVNESGEGDGPGNPPSKHRRTTTALSGSARNDLSRPEQSTLVRNMGRGRHSPPEFVVAFFHAIGAILWYQHTPELSKFIFHNPEYLTGLLKAVFTERLETESLRYANFQSHFSCGTFQQAKENLLERGIMSCDLLKCLWKHKQLDEEVFTAMMHLFIHMGFCVAQDRDQSGEVISLRFPWFLNEKVPDDPDLRQILFGAPTMTRLRITFEYEFLSICPPPMFEKFSVRMHRHTGDEMSRRDWKDGFQAKMYGSHLVVEKLHRGLETVIRFTVAGSDVPQLWKVLAKMKTEMQVVMEEWPGLKFDCHILCPHCIHQRVEKPSWFAGKYADTKCDPKQLHMTCRRNEAVTEIPPCLVYNVEGKSFCLFVCVVFCVSFMMQCWTSCR